MMDQMRSRPSQDYYQLILLFLWGDYDQAEEEAYNFHRPDRFLHHLEFPQLDGLVRDMASTSIW